MPNCYAILPTNCSHVSNHRKVCRQERSGSTIRGAALILVIMIIPALLTLFSIIFVVGYYSLVKKELQATADLVAYSAASKFCSSRDCFALVMDMATETLEQQSINGGLGRATRTNFLTSKMSDFTIAGPPPWNLPNVSNPEFIINVQRGRWLPPGSSNPGFENMDATAKTSPDWQTLHPGVPVFMAANAVRVEITRIGFLPGFFGTLGVLFSATADAVALADRPSAFEASNVGPFGIPVCSLLNNSSEFFPANLCFSDHLLTQVDRYCGSGDCTRVPNFIWEPVSDNTLRVGITALPITPEDTIESVYNICSNLGRTVDACITKEVTGPGSYYKEWSKTIPPSLTCGIGEGGPYSCEFLIDRECFWRRNTYSQPGDNFGFVGTTSGGASESLSSSLNGSARIGQSFSVLLSGFTQPASEEALWTKIKNSPVAYQVSDLAKPDDKLFAATPFRRNWLSYEFNPYWNPPKKFNFFEYQPEISECRDAADLPCANSCSSGPCYCTSPCVCDPDCQYKVVQVELEEAPVDSWPECKWHGVGANPVLLPSEWGYNLPPTSPLSSIDVAMSGGGIPATRTSLNPPLNFSKCNGCFTLSDVVIPFPGGPPITFKAPPTNGICNSRVFGPHPTFQPKGIGKHLDPKEYQHHVWETVIPVIADFSPGADACSKLFGANPPKDPIYDGAEDWKVIGFVRGDIYDLDIGNPPPTYPGGSGPGMYHRTNASDSPNMIWPPSYFTQNFPDQKRHPWGFPVQCNLVRSRLKCDTDFIGVADGKTALRRPTLVE